MMPTATARAGRGVMMIAHEAGVRRKPQSSTTGSADGSRPLNLQVAPRLTLMPAHRDHVHAQYVARGSIASLHWVTKSTLGWACRPTKPRARRDHQPMPTAGGSKPINAPPDATRLDRGTACTSGSSPAGRWGAGSQPATNCTPGQPIATGRSGDDERLTPPLSPSPLCQQGCPTPDTRPGVLLQQVCLAQAARRGRHAGLTLIRCPPRPDSARCGGNPRTAGYPGQRRSVYIHPPGLGIARVAAPCPRVGSAAGKRGRVTPVSNQLGRARRASCPPGRHLFGGGTAPTPSKQYMYGEVPSVLT